MLERQFGEVSEWLKEHAWKVCIRQRIGGSNPPLTAIFKLRACTEVRAFCLYVSPKPRGDENHRPGFDNWRSQLDRRRACEETARRASAASQSPPHRHIQVESLYRSTGFLLICDPSIAGWRHSSRAPYPVYISAAPPGNNTTIRLSILAKNFSEFYFAPLV